SVSWQVPDPPNTQSLDIGQHFLYAYVRDTLGDATFNVISFTVSNPVITSLAGSISATEGVRGSTLNINGNGFSTNPLEDIVTINGQDATNFSGTPTSTLI